MVARQNQRLQRLQSQVGLDQLRFLVGLGRAELIEPTVRLGAQLLQLRAPVLGGLHVRF